MSKNNSEEGLGALIIIGLVIWLLVSPPSCSYKHKSSESLNEIKQEKAEKVIEILEEIKEINAIIDSRRGLANSRK